MFNYPYLCSQETYLSDLKFCSGGSEYTDSLGIRFNLIVWIIPSEKSKMAAKYHNFMHFYVNYPYLCSHETYLNDLKFCDGVSGHTDSLGIRCNWIISIIPFQKSNMPAKYHKYPDFYFNYPYLCSQKTHLSWLKVVQWGVLGTRNLDIIEIY